MNPESTAIGFVTKRLASPVLAAALLVAGCSSDSESTPSSEPATTVSAPTPSTEPTDASSTTNSSDEPASETTAGDDGTSATDSSGDIVANPPKKTWLEAVDAAKAEFDGGLIEIELERHGSDRFEYKVVLVSDDTEFQIELDGDTLEIRSTDTDDLGDDAAEKRGRIFAPDEVIDLEEAAATARSEIDGAIDEWELEGKDDGRIEYEFEIIPTGGTDDVEVEIDARTGEVLDVD